MKIDARLTFDKVRHDQDNNAHLVLTLTAPAIEAEAKRPSLCIIPLIDVSPSMEGLKLAYAKRSVEKLIDHLGPNDYCGLVKFSGNAQVLQTPVKVTADSKTSLKKHLTALRTDSATNIADAMLTGLGIGNKMDLPGTVLVRVILFTDGQANRGPATDAAGLLKLLKANIGSCTFSAFGYGADADQNLLAELAKAGAGNYAFVHNPDDALTAFGKELGGLLSCYATNLVLNVSACAEHEITDVISDVDSEEEKIGHGVRIKIPDVLAEEVRHIVLGVKLKAQKSGPRAVNAFEVKAGWDVIDANSKKERKGAEVKAKVQFVKDGDQQTKPDAELDKLVSLAELIQAQAQAEEMIAKKADYQGAAIHMQNMATNLGNRGQTASANLAYAVSGRLCSADRYASNSAYLRSMANGVTRGVAGTYEVQAAADLGNLGVQMNTSSQTATSASFVDAAPSLVVAPDASSLVAVPSLVGVTTGSAVDLTGGVNWGGAAIMGGSIYLGSTPVGGGVDLSAWPAGPVDPGPAPCTPDKAQHVAKKPPSKKGLSKKSKTW